MEHNNFQKGVCLLIDDHLEYLKSDEAKSSLHVLGESQFAHEYRVLKISGRRQCGHTSIVNEYAFNIMESIGRRHSTLIVTPTHNIAVNRMFLNHSMLPELSISYATEYRNVVKGLGKILTMGRINTLGFSRSRYLNEQRDAVYQLTGNKVDKFDIMFIDSTYGMSPKDIDKIIDTFDFDVELFVFLQ